MNLGNLNLNLLTALDAILRERSVTGAAARLGLTQPAVSASLSRLRRHFGDQLLVRAGNAYELTPFAQQLREPVAAAITQVEQVFDPGRAFDPQRSDRVFSVLASDYVTATLGATASRMLSALAPGARLDFHPHTPSMIERIEPTLREVDGVVLPRGFIADLPHRDLYSDTWVCIVDENNRRIGDSVTLDQLAASPWVVTFRSMTAFTPPMRHLEGLGLDLNVQAVVEHFLALPSLIVGTNRVAIVQKRLVDLMKSAFPIRAVPCPFDAPPIVEALWWHPTREGDPAQRWLRGLLTQAGKQMSSAG